jgi:hypothetical protein
VILDQVASHGTNKRRRAAETERSKPDEIPDFLFGGIVGTHGRHKQFGM